MVAGYEGMKEEVMVCDIKVKWRVCKEEEERKDDDDSLKRGKGESRWQQ